MNKAKQARGVCACSSALVYVAISVAYSLVGGVVFLLRPGVGKGDGQPPEGVGLAGSEEQA